MNRRNQMFNSDFLTFFIPAKGSMNSPMKSTGQLYDPDARNLLLLHLIYSSAFNQRLAILYATRYPTRAGTTRKTLTVVMPKVITKDFLFVLAMLLA